MTDGSMPNGVAQVLHSTMKRRHFNRAGEMLPRPQRSTFFHRAGLQTDGNGGRMCRVMKSLLQWFRNRLDGRHPIPRPDVPGERQLRWMERAFAAVESALGSPSAAAATRRRWDEDREREAAQREAELRCGAGDIMFSSGESAARALLSMTHFLRTERNDSPSDGWRPKFDSPEELSSVLNAFFAAHPATRTTCAAFAQRIRNEVNRKFDGDAPAFYRAAGISRFQYSKLLSHPESSRPSKDTALRMALALQCSLDEASDLLALAGHALSPAIPEDRVWAACFAHGLYHLPTVLQYLERHAGSGSGA